MINYSMITMMMMIIIASIIVIISNIANFIIILIRVSNRFLYEGLIFRVNLLLVETDYGIL